MTEKVRLLRKLVLETKRATPDGAGGYDVVWDEQGVLWADVSPRSGREDFIGAQDRPRVKYRILVRAAPVGAPSRPRSDQRFREGARIFDILTVAERDPAGRYLEIIAEEGISM